jgi:ParB-like chromosome segregation protein Spo0J
MLNKRPIVVNKDMIVLGGNMRLKACIEAGMKDVPVIVADWSEEQQREFIIKDNVSGGEWDWDVLANEWDVDQLTEWGLDVPDISEQSKTDLSDDLESEFKIEIDCVSEREQEKLYKELSNNGYKCKILTL